MKICISSTGPDLNSPVDPRFGRCAHFLIVDEKTEKFEALSNPGIQSWHGAGITAAQAVASSGVKVVISGNFGPNAFFALNQAGIKCFPIPGPMSCKQALDMYKQGKLQSLAKPSVPGHFGGGRRGGGFGKGPGR